VTRADRTAGVPPTGRSDGPPEVLYAFDAGAVLALLDGDGDLAALVFDASANGFRIAVPLMCMFEAAAAVDGATRTRDRLLMLLRVPVLRIVALADEDRGFVAAVSERVGSHAVAHVGITALTYRCRVFTTRAADLWPIGLAEWQLMAI
jgi:hypothetical protein